MPPRMQKSDRVFPSPLWRVSRSFWSVPTYGGAPHRPLLEHLPGGWDQRPPTAASQDFGTDRLESERSPALQVPSVLFPTEARNYILNPAHPEFDAAVQVDESQPLNLDPRIEARLGETSP